MKHVLSILTLLLFVLSGCGNKPDQLESIKKEVMDVHDEVMPKMGELRSVRKSLIEKSKAADSTAANRLDVLAKNLEVANDQMMSWMNQYEPQFEGTEEEKIKYYKDQNASIQTVKNSMLNALEAGQKALAE